MGCGAGPGGRSKQRRPRSQFALKRQPTLWWRAPRARPRVAACRPPARPSALGRVAHIVMCGPWGGQAISWSVRPGLASRAMAPPPRSRQKKTARDVKQRARGRSLCAPACGLRPPAGPTARLMPSVRGSCMGVEVALHGRRLSGQAGAWTKKARSRARPLARMQRERSAASARDGGDLCPSPYLPLSRGGCHPPLSSPSLLRAPSSAVAPPFQCPPTLFSLSHSRAPLTHNQPPSPTPPHPLPPHPQIIAVAALALAGSASAAKNDTKMYVGKLAVLEELSNKVRLFSQPGRGCVFERDR